MEDPVTHEEIDKAVDGLNEIIGVRLEMSFGEEWEEGWEEVEERAAPLAWNVLKSVLEKFTFNMIEEISGLAGLSSSDMKHIKQGLKSYSKWQLLNGIESRFLNYYNEDFQKRFIDIVAEEILKKLERTPDKRSSLQQKLSRLGYNLIGNAVIPIEVLDASTLKELPSESHADLTKAAQRLRDGDLSGAITSACSALDAVTSAIYALYNRGNPTAASFQERCKLSLEAKGVFSKMEQQLYELGWKRDDIKRFCNNFKGAINQGAYVMQTLRSKMGDVHGTKPILKPLVFDSLRWAEITLRSLTDE